MPPFDKTVLRVFAVMLITLVVVMDSWLKQWRANKENKKWVQDILALSLEEAMRQAEPMLSDPEYFELTPAEAEDVEIARTFGPALHSLFSRYAVIRYDWNDMHLSCRDIASYEWDSRYVKIGSGLYGHALLVLPQDDRVHEVWDQNPNPQNWGQTIYPSIYHWLLLEFRDY
jgi:hypothetical protein